jgi:hypothetical protein
MAQAPDDNNLSPPFAVDLMPQQLGIRVVGDDWTGITSTEERRKLQNRLNQRAWSKYCHITFSNIVLIYNYVGRRQAAGPLPSPTSQESGQISLASSTTAIPTSAEDEGSRVCNTNIEAIQNLVEEYANAAYRDYILGLPLVSRLLTLVQFNVFRAFLNNTSTIGFTLEWLDGDAISPFGDPGYSYLNATCPANMLPTQLQLTISHHPWVDLLPSPVMRDNILLALENDWDDTNLCKDLVEFSQEPKEMTGFIIWGEPWDIGGWEVTEGFLSKYAWCIRGCPELLRSTNHWRETRGEKWLFSNAAIERQWKAKFHALEVGL